MFTQCCMVTKVAVYIVYIGGKKGVIYDWQAGRPLQFKHRSVPPEI